MASTRLGGAAGTAMARMAVLGAGMAALLPAMANAGAPGGRAPENILPQTVATPEAMPTARATKPAPLPLPANRPMPQPSATPSPIASPAGAALPPAGPVGSLAPQPVMQWSLSDAVALLQVIEHIGSEGLLAADYQPEALRAAIDAGPGPALDAQASKSFDWLAEDMRDGRTPMDDRIQWFVIDPDVDANPTASVLAKALASHDIPGTLGALEPTYPDFNSLKQALALTSPNDTRLRDLIRANIDRWRWLPRDLGTTYLITNVPEFQMRLTVNGRIVRTYRTIVGKPGRTATPQLAEKVEAVVFNPTWTVPQSIVVGEGLGAKLSGNPASARRQGYKVTTSADGSISVVQQPGDRNSLGRMKIDMPNPHAIYLHDTPNKKLFDAKVRAFSHGCIRTERALELGMTMGILAGNLTPEEGVALYNSLKYKRVVMSKTFPVYITYFTMARGIDGQLSSFDDIYGRDDAVLASFAKPRELKTIQRSSNQEVIVADNPL